MTILEITVYAALLGGGAPTVCHLDEAAVARCSNGLVADQLSGTQIRFRNGVTVTHEGSNFPSFSNGIHSWWASAGWLQFSNGIGVRRLGSSSYAFTNGLVCTTELPELINCAMKKS